MYLLHGWAANSSGLKENCFIVHDIFSCIGVLSGCIDFGESVTQDNALFYTRMSKLKTWEDFNKLDWGTQLYLAQCAAFVPNQKKPPFYCEFPFKEGRVKNKRVYNKFLKHDGFYILEENVDSLKKAAAIYIDCGTEDNFINHARKLDKNLQNLGIEHQYKEYRGMHFSGIIAGSGNALELFSTALKYEYTY